MKYDIDRMLRGTPIYSEMSPEEYAYRKALKWQMSSNSRERNASYGVHGLQRGWLRVDVSDEGKINAKFDGLYKDENSKIKIKTANKCLEELLNFLSISFDFGYLVEGGSGNELQD